MTAPPADLDTLQAELAQEVGDLPEAYDFGPDPLAELAALLVELAALHARPVGFCRSGAIVGRLRRPVGRPRRGR